MNDNEERPVTIITGRVWKKKGGKPEGVHVMLVAPDDDSAVRRALESLAAEGYAEAELDQIGDMEGEPDDEPHLSAFQGALEGEVSIVTFDVRSDRKRDAPHLPCAAVPIRSDNWHGRCLPVMSDLLRDAQSSKPGGASCPHPSRP